MVPQITLSDIEKGLGTIEQASPEAASKPPSRQPAAGSGDKETVSLPEVMEELGELRLTPEE